MLATERDTALQQQSEGLERLLHSLLEISNFVGSVMMLDDILERIVQITSEMMGVPVCSIYLLNEQRQLVMRSNIGFEPELIGQPQFEWGQGIPGWVAMTGEVISLAHPQNDPRYQPLPSALEQGCRAYLCAPLRIQEEVIGVMTARRMDERAYTWNEILFFETVCKQVAIVIEKARMHEDKLAADRLAAVAVSLTGVAHYIKNVLLTIQGGEYLVDQGLLAGQLDKARQGWQVLRRANRKIRGLVENILNYCRQTKLNLRTFDMNDLLREVADSLEELARERHATIQLQLDEHLEPVTCDQDQLYDALLNLTTNALDAMPEDRAGQVILRSVRLEGRHQFLLEVADNGVGIPEEAREKIFNLFFSTKGDRGTGIGLAATRSIVEAHGGTIELESELGRGSIFRLFMPFEPPDSAS